MNSKFNISNKSNLLLVKHRSNCDIIILQLEVASEILLKNLKLFFFLIRNNKKRGKKRESVFCSRILVGDESQEGESVTAGKKKSKQTKSLRPERRKDYIEN